MQLQGGKCASYWRPPKVVHYVSVRIGGQAWLFPGPINTNSSGKFTIKTVLITQRAFPAPGNGFASLICVLSVDFTSSRFFLASYSDLFTAIRVSAIDDGRRQPS